MSASLARVTDSARTNRKTIASTAPIGGRWTPRYERKSASENVVAAADTVPHGARAAAPAAARQRDERGGDEPEEVRVDGAEGERAVVVGRDGDGEHRDADDGGEPGEAGPGAPDLERDDAL